jgi:DNA-binding winged helix-turn-helix (wHTH) protein
MKDFRINNAYTVMPEKNLVNEVKLEPRLMKLLCLLAEKPRQVISREEIVETIWKGYGGGDEGLTQAISFLRKLLKDDEKKIIETVPKAGYIFNADVELQGEEIKKRTDKKSPRWPVYGIATVIIFVLLWLLLSPKTQRVPNAPQPREASADKPAIAPKNEK